MPRLRISLVQALRGLHRSTGFSTVAIITLALGIAAAVSMFTLVNGVLLRPLPYPGADNLVNVEHQTPKGPAGGLDIASMDDFATGSQTAEGFAAYRSLGFLELGWLDRPEAVPALEVTWNFLDLLGSRPALGSYFRREHERGGNPVVVLTHAAWTRLFARDPAAVGKVVRLNDRGYTVIGVTPKDLELPRNSSASVLLPLDRVGQQVDYARIAHRCIARTKPGISPAQLEVDLARVSERAAALNPAARFPAGWSMRVVSLQRALLGDRRQVSFILLGASLVLLTIACVNVATLFLLRALDGRQDIAVRASLGANTCALLAHHAAEGVIVALAGTALGTALTELAVRAMPTVLQSFANVNGIERLRIDPVVCAFALGLTFVTSVVFALAPMLGGGRLDLAQALRSGGSRSGRRGQGYRTFLLVSQAALAGLLITTAGLFARSFSNAVRIDPGFDSRDLVVVRFNLPEARYASVAAVANFQRELLSRIAVVPGVQSASGALFTPFEADAMSVFCSGVPATLPMGQWERCVLDGVGEGYFRALRIPIVSGRDMVRGEADAAIVNETLARRLFPGASPVGRVVRLPIKDAKTGAPHTDVRIVGVSRDSRNLGLTASVTPRLSLPFDRFCDSGFSVFVRSTLPPESLRASLDAQVRSLDPLLPIRSVTPLDVIAGDSVGDLRQNALLLCTYTLLGVALAALGMYTVVAFAVSQRMREIGIRMALGATCGRVIWMVMAEGALPLGMGAVVGSVAAAAVGRVVRHQLFGVAPDDPVNLVCAVLLLAIVGGLAFVVPARRASHVDPMATLRDA